MHLQLLLLLLVVALSACLCLHSKTVLKVPVMLAQPPSYMCTLHSITSIAADARQNPGYLESVSQLLMIPRKAILNLSEKLGQLDDERQVARAFADRPFLTASACIFRCFGGAVSSWSQDHSQSADEQPLIF